MKIEFQHTETEFQKIRRDFVEFWQSKCKNPFVAEGIKWRNDFDFEMPDGEIPEYIADFFAEQWQAILGDILHDELPKLEFFGVSLPELVALKNPNNTEAALALTAFLTLASHKLTKSAEFWFPRRLEKRSTYGATHQRAGEPIFTEAQEAAIALVGREAVFAEIFDFEMREFIEFYCRKTWAEQADVPFFAQFFRGITEFHLRPELTRLAEEIKNSVPPWATEMPNADVDKAWRKAERKAERKLEKKRRELEKLARKAKEAKAAAIANKEAKAAATAITPRGKDVPF